jgi:putative iron-dependent peroxidase
MTPRFQPAILAPVPSLARYLEFDLRHGADARAAIAHLNEIRSPDRTVVGLGQPLLLAAAVHLPGLRSFSGIAGAGCVFPSTQHALWVFLGGSDTTDLHDRSRATYKLLENAFVVRDEVACFRYREGRDLSGYEDGTENPKEDAAARAAIVQGAGAGLDGSSFVAAQRWVHALDVVEALSADARDAVIGRSLSDNQELPDAPPSAHVKRAAQESFDPPAFMVRRSMPWGGANEHGLYFVAYGESLDRFERVLRRMAGLDDGIVDGLLSFTRAVSGGYYWCPPVDTAGTLDVSRVIASPAE